MILRITAAVAGANSLGFKTAQFPPAMAPIKGVNNN